ncbi:Thioredoxin reductase [Rhodovastum atsumiense]|uniref:Thioredoxin reductase n=1 Tax=Rhodovastum atsumiense TaxID=504468 RepID=A0A5M6IK06_9PROT|nr:NAD(P)/FAD-dependent oxidoreductase [Rhodovastum atsumiense]KAA5608227.1 NAD(P)/FAD-dependent oxidoreductase [Rhodovastum atsumiense]CAH2599380.1 Thioredoxin reductase [Rhodovastum atsumiense]
MQDVGNETLDCLVVGGGPAGLTAALYLARFRRRVVVVDAGAPRAAWIPKSHNIPLFAAGIPGPEILERARAAVRRYGVAILPGEVTQLRRTGGLFAAGIAREDGTRCEIRAERVVLATGSVDVEPALPDLPDAVRRGLVRYCPICDGFESRDRRIAVIGHGARGLGEAAFIARSYAEDVTLLTLGQPLRLDARQQEIVARHRIRVIEQPVAALEQRDGMIAAIRMGDGAEHRFDVLYSALGLTYRSGLAVALGAAHDPSGALITDAHAQTSVPGLYAAGDIVRGLDQIVVGMAHAAAAATHVHNRCGLPTEDEPEAADAHPG